MSSDSTNRSDETDLGITARALWITAALSGVVLVFGLVPVLTPPSGLDGVAHAIAFACLVLPSAVIRPALLWVLIPTLSCFGVLLEMTQPVFGREASGADGLANIAGLLVGAAIGKGIRHALIARIAASKGGI